MVLGISGKTVVTAILAIILEMNESIFWCEYGRHLFFQEMYEALFWGIVPAPVFQKCAKPCFWDMSALQREENVPACQSGVLKSALE